MNTPAKAPKNLSPKPDPLPNCLLKRTCLTFEVPGPNMYGLGFRALRGFAYTGYVMCEQGP